jgi:hypothetical protein
MLGPSDPITRDIFLMSLMRSHKLEYRCGFAMYVHRVPHIYNL